MLAKKNPKGSEKEVHWTWKKDP